MRPVSVVMAVFNGAATVARAIESVLGQDYDGVVDFDKALRDPERPTQMLPIYDCGDGLHPSDLGYCTMGDAIDLALFD